eukprot:1158060-Pelagomonas_calceolata.AAC.3
MNSEELKWSCTTIPVKPKRLTAVHAVDALDINHSSTACISSAHLRLFTGFPTVHQLLFIFTILITLLSWPEMSDSAQNVRRALNAKGALNVRGALNVVGVH